MRRIATVAFSGLLMLSSLSASAEEFHLPDVTEIQSYSPETQQFYNAGIAAIDRVDYANAYNMMAKASQLQPGAVRLNRLAAGLALKHGRSAPAEQAQDFYETAISCLRNILAQPGVENKVRREIENQLKIALDEQANLAQRDVTREAVGNGFIRELNRQYAEPTPDPLKLPTGPAKPPAIPAASGNPLAPGGLPAVPGNAVQPAQPVVPGVGLPQPPAGIPMPAYPGAPASGNPGLPPIPGVAPVPGTVPAPAGGAPPPI